MDLQSINLEVVDLCRSVATFIRTEQETFDKTGGFWFTDLGKARARDIDRGGLYYAKADGSFITEAIYPMLTPNGCGLSPDEKTLYAAETQTGRVWKWDLEGPGKLAAKQMGHAAAGGQLLADRPRYAQHWLTFWNDLLRNDYQGTGYIDGGRQQISP